MKRVFTIFLTGLLLLSAAPAAFAKGKIENTPLKKYTDPDGRFSIKLPKKWIVEPGESKGVLVKAAVKPFGEPRNPNVVITAVESSTELADDIKETKVQYGQIFTNHRLLDDRKFTVKGTKAHLLGSRLDIEDVAVRNQQLFVKKGSTFYIITATTYLEDWDSHKKLFKKIFRSFKVQ